MQPDSDYSYWVNLPEALGRVVKLRRVNDSIIAETTSGIPYVIPLYGGERKVQKINITAG